VTMAEIDRLGMEAAVDTALDRLRAAAWVHVSLDMDVMDPLHAPGVGTPVPGGISYREAHLMMEMVAESRLMGSLQVVEVNPILDVQNQSAQLAVELLVHKGRQAAASQVKAPEYLGPEAPVGKFPRSVPIDNKGTSTYIDFWHATPKQIALAIGSRRMMEEGLGYRVMELQGRFAAMVELESAEPVKEIES